MKNGEWLLCFNKNPTSPLALPGLREAETRGGWSEKTTCHPS